MMVKNKYFFRFMMHFPNGVSLDKPLNKFRFQRNYAKQVLTG